MFLFEANPPRLELENQPIKIQSYTEGRDGQREIIGELAFDRLRGVSANDWLPGLHIYLEMKESEAIPGGYLYTMYWDEENSGIEFCVSFGSQDGIWRDHVATAAIYQRLLSVNESDSKIELTYDRDMASLDVRRYIDTSDEAELYDLVSEVLERLRRYIFIAESDLFGFTWTDELLNKETEFTQKVVIPILRKLGYSSVRYNHGVSEFGKDILFGDTDRFGNHRWLAAQVKVGDISLSRRKELDTLISQIDDAFAVGVATLGDTTRRQIGALYVVTNGAITEHAAQIIRSKVNSRISANLFFLDRTDIEFWARKFWPLI